MITAGKHYHPTGIIDAVAIAEDLFLKENIIKYLSKYLLILIANITVL